MAISLLDMLGLIEIKPLDSDGVEQTSVFLGSRWWVSGSGDTPASTPILTTFDAQSLKWEGGWHKIQEDGLWTPGGMGIYGAQTIRVANPAADDGSAPLDALDGYFFEGARAFIYLTQAVVGATGPTVDIARASLDQWFEASITSFSLDPGSQGMASLSLTAPTDHQSPSTPIAYRGFETASQTDISRPDHAALRATGNFTVKLIMRYPAPAASAAFTMPLLRWRDVSGTGALTWGVRNAAGGWQDFTALSALPALGYFAFHVTYNSSTFKARLYQDGVFQEELTITSGLYASAGAAATTWATSGTAWLTAGTQHLSVTLTDAEVADDARRGVEDHASATMTLRFNEAVGVVAVDDTGNQNATTSGTWGATGEGLATMAESRPPALVGNVFLAPAIEESQVFGLLLAGYAGERTAILHLAEQGVRRKPEQTTASATITITAAHDTLSRVPGTEEVEFAQGQAIVRSPASGAGNPTNMTVKAVLGSPAALNNTTNAGLISTDEDQTSGEATAMTLADDTDNDYLPATPTVIRDGTTYSFPGAVIYTTASEALAFTLTKEAADTGVSAVEHIFAKFGGSKLLAGVVYRENTASDDLWRHGWMVPGDAPVGELLDMVARSSLAENGYGPLGVFYEQDGDIGARGMWLAVQGTDDFDVPSDAVLDIVEWTGGEKPRPRRVKVLYQRNWSVVKEPLTGSADALESASRREWAEVVRGSGDATGTIESSQMALPAADAQAAGLKRLQNFRVYIVRLRSPLPASLIRDATNGPFLQTTITWAERTAWAAGKTGFTVAFNAQPFAPAGQPALTLYFATEE